MPRTLHRTAGRCSSTLPRPKRLWPAALLAGLLLLAGIVPGLPTGTATATTPPEVASGAPWLAQQLVTSQGLLNTTFDGSSYPDYGLTADAVLGLAATGEGAGAADEAVGQLEADVSDYSGDSATILYAGATAKLLLVAEANGTDATSFGGRNLVAQLTGLQQTSGSSNGRFTDQWVPGFTYPGGYTPTDNSNSLVQALAIIALQRAGVTETGIDDAAAYLALQQCPGGGVRVTEADTACTDDTTADPDITGVALQAFVAADDTTAADKAAAWLLARQRSDGSFTSTSQDLVTPIANANTTAVIEGGLLAHGDTVAAAKARGFLAGLQLGCAAPAADRGAIAYDAADRDAAVFGGGITSASLDSFRRASTQALMGLANVSYLDTGSTTATPDVPAAACTTPLLTAAYRGVLDRAPDASGLAYWTPRLSSGTNGLVMIASLAASAEAAGHLVDVEYQLMLGRAADPGGRAYWTGIYRSSHRADLVDELLVASPERFSAAGGTNKGWVANALYQQLLGRTADPNGLNYWTTMADAVGPAGRRVLVSAFLHTPEGIHTLLARIAQPICGTTGLSATRTPALAAGLKATGLNPLLTSASLALDGC